MFEANCAGAEEIRVRSSSIEVQGFVRKSEHCHLSDIVQDLERKRANNGFDRQRELFVCDFSACRCCLELSVKSRTTSFTGMEGA